MQAAAFWIRSCSSRTCGDAPPPLRTGSHWCLTTLCHRPPPLVSQSGTGSTSHLLLLLLQLLWTQAGWGEGQGFGVRGHQLLFVLLVQLSWRIKDKLTTQHQSTREAAEDVFLYLSSCWRKTFVLLLLQGSFLQLSPCRHTCTHTPEV